MAGKPRPHPAAGRLSRGSQSQLLGGTTPALSGGCCRSSRLVTQSGVRGGRNWFWSRPAISRRWLTAWWSASVSGVEFHLEVTPLDILDKKGAMVFAGPIGAVIPGSGCSDL
jgi:hypothetical protein